MASDYQEISPSRSRLTPWKRAFFKDRLVDDAVDSRFDNAAQRVDPLAIKWARDYDRITRLATPCGTLAVFAGPGGWTATRDAAALVQPSSPKPALFSTKRSAQAAALLHMADGFDDAVPLNGRSLLAAASHEKALLRRPDRVFCVGRVSQR